MELHEQSKTTQGRIPICDVEVRKDEGLIRFKRQETGGMDNPGKRLRIATQSKPRLEDFAFLWDAEGRILQERLADLALRTGPLFGEFRDEWVGDWVAEATMAKDTLHIQRAINGDFQLSALEDRDGSGATVSKSVMYSRHTNNHLSTYCCTLNLPPSVYTRPDSAFYERMPEFPHFRKFTSSGCFDYAFVERQHEEEVENLSVTLLSFKREITAYDFARALEACSVDEGSAKKLMEQVLEETGLERAELERQRKNVLSDSDWRLEVPPLDKNDLPHLQHLVQAIASLRLTDISVDVFRSEESDDFLLFPMYASYLWYRFAKQLNQVKIGYCEYCGRGYSKTGTRGKERRYCSNKCRSDAKNERNRDRALEQRRLFSEGGLSVAQIAEKTYADKLAEVSTGQKDECLKDLCEKVRACLKECVEFKNRADSELKVIAKSKGVSANEVLADAAALAEAPFARRCLEEGVFSLADLEDIVSRYGGGRRRA